MNSNTRCFSESDCTIEFMVLVRHMIVSLDPSHLQVPFHRASLRGTIQRGPDGAASQVCAVLGPDSETVPWPTFLFFFCNQHLEL